MRRAHHGQHLKRRAIVGIAVVLLAGAQFTPQVPPPVSMTTRSPTRSWTAQPGVGLVEFSIDGDPIDVPRADGSLTDSAVTRDDYAPLFSI